MATKKTTTTASAKKTANMAKPEAAPKTDPKPSAAPGTSDDSGKKKAKKAKVQYPGLKGEDDKPIRLTEWPADFDASLHKPLRRVDFENDAVWFEKKAEEYDAKAADMREKAEISRKLGNSADRAKAKKFKKMKDQMAKLQSELEAQGVDIAAMLEQITGGQAEAKDE